MEYDISYIRNLKDICKGEIMTTMGKFRHLGRCSTDTGNFCILAIDHRDNLLASLNRHAAAPLDDAGFTQFKVDVLQALSPFASAVLTDPAYGIGAGTVDGALNPHAGLLAPIEVTNYDLHPSERDLDFIPHWSVAKIKKMGGDGVKLLLPYHPQAPNAAVKQAQVVQIISECAEQDIPFFLEPIAYALDPSQKLTNHELRQITVEMARTFSEMGVDVLKMQFPLDPHQSENEREREWLDACNELDAACGDVPWALLSAGVSYETFALQARIACEAGASGVIVGRAVWSEAVTLQGDARQEFLYTTAKSRMRELAEICEDAAASWLERVSPPDASVNWYENY